MKPMSSPDIESPSAKIDRRIEELGDWRGETTAVAANSAGASARGVAKKK